MSNQIDTADALAARLQMMILGATGATVRVLVWEKITIMAETIEARDAAAAFVGARPEFALIEHFECRGTFRATFRPVVAA